MKKLIVAGLLAASAVIGLRSLAKRMQQTREHFGEMAAQCKEMAAQMKNRGEPVGTV